MDRRPSKGVLTVVLVVHAACAALAQQPAHDHDPKESAAEISSSRHTFSPELERIKSLAGRWEGATYRASEGTNPAVVTYSITAAGSAVVETMFPGEAREMTTVYHDDSSGHLVADHYCTAANQPKLRLIRAAPESMEFILAPESDLNAGVEGHAHQLKLSFGADGTLTHDWLNHYLGRPGQERNIRLSRAQ